MDTKIVTSNDVQDENDPNAMKGFAVVKAESIEAAVGIAKKIVESAKKRQLYAFPRYTNGSECNANYASATLNQWIRSLGIDKTTH